MTFSLIKPTDVAVTPPAEPVTLERDAARGGFGPYVLSSELATTINVAIALSQPLLVTGEPGCGKTSLAWAIAAQLGCDVLEFHTKSTSVARDLLYTVDTLRRFHDASTGDARAKDAAGYIAYRALGQAIRSERTQVVLIDEVDKAPRDLPNDLLDELDRMQFTVTEVDPPQTFKARAKHVVLITSNSERRLPLPFLRRCVYAHLEFPTAAELAKIVSLHVPEPGKAFVELCVKRFLELRSIDGLVKPPATSELIGWVRVLQRMGVEPSALDKAVAGKLPALETLIKMVDDLRVVRGVTPLSDLLDALRADGFPIGIDDHVRVGRLLALDTPWSEGELRIAVRAVIAKDVRERAAFDAVWARVFPARPAHPFDGRVPHLDELPNAAKRRYHVQQRAARRRIAALVALFVVAVVVGSFAVSRLHGAKPDAGVAFDAAAVPLVDGGVVAMTAPNVVPAAPVAPAPPEPPHDDTPDLAMIGGGGALLVVCIALGLIARRRRTQAVRGPFRYTPNIPAANRPVLASRDIEDAAANLTWQTEVAGAELDLDRTVHATVAAGGLPSFVYRAPPAAPSYVVLEDTERPWGFVYDELLRGLAREGVTIERWTFHGDPSWCTNGRERRPLRDVVEHCDALIAIGDAATAFDPLADAAPEWVRVLRHVPKRLWINPLPEARWSRGAHEIARDTVMEHGVASALAALRAGSDRRDRPDAPLSAIALRAPASAPGLAALQTHLGPDGMRLVGALALAGAPSVAAARWLAERFKTVDPTAPKKFQRRGPTPEPPRGITLDDAAWLRVLALPWLSDGAWPPELQAKLAAYVRHTAPALAKAVDSAMTEVIRASEPPVGSAAHLRWQLDVASRTPNPDVSALRASPLHREVEQRFGRRPAWLAAVAIVGALVAMAGAGRYAVAHLRSEPVVADAAIDAPSEGLPSPPDGPPEYREDGMPPYVPPEAGRDPALDEIPKLVHDSKPAIQACYERAPDLRGTTRFDLDLAIAPDGVVTLAGITPEAPALAKCISALMATWHVDGSATRTVRYPIVFEPPNLALFHKALAARDLERIEMLVESDRSLVSELDHFETQLVKDVESDVRAHDCDKAHRDGEAASRIAGMLKQWGDLDRTELAHAATERVRECKADIGKLLTAMMTTIRPGLDKCFLTASTPGSKVIEIRVDVEPDGKISSVNIPSLTDATARQCMGDLLRAQKLDAGPDGGAQWFAYSIDFSAVVATVPAAFIVVGPMASKAGAANDTALITAMHDSATGSVAKSRYGSQPVTGVTGFFVDGTLNSLTVKTAGDVATVSCKVSLLLASFPDKSVIGFLNGGADVKGGTSRSDIESAGSDCVSAVIEDLVVKQVFPTIAKKIAPSAD